MGILLGGSGCLLPKLATRLSELEIDADKDWNTKGVTNLKELALGMTKGDIFFRQGGVLVKLSPGPIGHELTTGGPGQPIAWEPPPGKTVPTMVTDDATEITTTTAVLNGRMTWNGREDADHVYFDWDTDSGEPYANTEDLGPGGEGSYEIELTGLTDGTPHYFRIRAHNSKGDNYGAEKTFNTIDIVAPTMVTHDADEITDTGAKLHGEVTDTGHDNPTRYFDWWPESVEVAVSAPNDDVNLFWTGAAWTLELDTTAQWAGWYLANYAKCGLACRFLNITIPPGFTIQEARLKSIAFQNRTEAAVRTRLHGEQDADPLTFSDYADYAARTRTDAVVDWDDIEAWAEDEEYQSPDIKDIIQEIIDLGGWASGKPMVIFWDDHDDRSAHNSYTVRRCKSYEHADNQPVRLYIRWGQTEEDLGVGGVGLYEKEISGLTPDTKYYFKARGVNIGGTGVGAEKTFTTLAA